MADCTQFSEDWNSFREDWNSFREEFNKVATKLDEVCATISNAQENWRHLELAIGKMAEEEEAAEKENGSANAELQLLKFNSDESTGEVERPVVGLMVKNQPVPYHSPSRCHFPEDHNLFCGEGKVTVCIRISSDSFLFVNVDQICDDMWSSKWDPGGMSLQIKFSLVALDSAYKVFDKMSEREVCSWTSLLCGNAKQDEREFRAEVEAISRIHHRHLVSLVGYCISEDQRLLVYDYVSNNSLYFHLHGKDRPVMDRRKRVKIVAGAARGIAYLHDDCHPRIMHRDIKSANILLDDNFEDRVSDFGLAKLAIDANTHVTTRVMGTCGYMAPEYASSGKLTENSDVFSFGVVLLELITGRKSVDTSQPLGDENLVEWARPLLSQALETGEFEGLADPRLEKSYADKEMFLMIEVVAACVRHSTVKRPRMGQVMRAFDGMATADLTNGTIGSINYAAYDRLIQRFTDRRLLRQGKQLHARFLLSSVVLDNFLASKIITFYSKLGNLLEAHRVFDEIPQRNTFSWHALLAGYSFNNMHAETVKLFSSWLSSPGFAKPDNFTVTSVLKALSSLSPDLAKIFHGFVMQDGLDWDVFATNPLVTFYSRCDDIASARKLFDTMPEKDMVTWNSMIAAYWQEGYLRPNGVTVLSVLQACGQSNDLLFGMDVHQFIIANDIDMDLSLCNSIIALYAKCGSLDYARELLENMSEQNEVTNGAIISGYMLHGFVDQALDIFQEVETPAWSIWNAIISGLIQSNRQLREALCLYHPDLNQVLHLFDPGGTIVAALHDKASSNKLLKEHLAIIGKLTYLSLMSSIIGLMLWCLLSGQYFYRRCHM